MRKVLALLWVLLAFSCDTEEDAGPAQSNTFIKYFGGPNQDDALNILQTQDDGFIILGTSEIENPDGPFSYKIRLIKTDLNGNTVWDKQYPSFSEESDNYTANSLIINEGGYLIIGDRINENETTSLLMLQIDNQGNEVKSNTVTITDNSDTIAIHGIDLISNNSQLKVLGQIESDDLNMYVGTVNLNNLEVIPSCSFRYSATDSDPTVLKSINIDSNGDIIFGSTTANNSRLVRVPDCQNSEITGPLIKPGTSSTYIANQMVKSAFGFIMIGTTEENNNKDIFIANVDKNGINPQIKVFTEVDGVALSEDDEGYTIAATGDGGFIIGGETLSSTAGETDMIVIKTDASGDVQWSRRFGDQNEEAVQLIRQTNDGGFLILGTTEFGGIDTMVLIKTDREGNIN